MQMLHLDFRYRASLRWWRCTQRSLLYFPAGYSGVAGWLDGAFAKSRVHLLSFPSHRSGPFLRHQKRPSSARWSPDPKHSFQYQKSHLPWGATGTWCSQQPAGLWWAPLQTVLADWASLPQTCNSDVSAVSLVFTCQAYCLTIQHWLGGRKMGSFCWPNCCSRVLGAKK